MLLDEALGSTLFLDLEIVVRSHVTFDDNARQSIHIPHDIAVHPISVVRLVPWGASTSMVRRIGAWEGTVKVDECYLDRLIKGNHNVVWLEVSMHETQVVQLL